MRLVFFMIVIATVCWTSKNSLAQSRVENNLVPVIGDNLISPMSQGEALKPNGSFYFGGYQTSQNGLPVVVHLYEHRIGGETEVPTWLPWALRLIGQGADQRFQWASGQSCPAIYGLHQMLSDFPSPRFRRPRFNDQLPVGVRTIPRPPITLDGGATVAIWGYSTQSDGGTGTVMITGREGMIQDWVQFASEQTDLCWTNEAPKFTK